MPSRREFVAMSAAAAIPKDGRTGSQHVYELRGTPFEVGVQHGQALRQEIRAEAQPAAESLARRRKTTVEAKLARVLSQYEGLFREHVPAVLEEIRGLGEGAEVSYPYAFFAATRDGMGTDACTAIACSAKQTKDGHVLIGQNKDTRSPLDRFRIMRIAYESGRRMIVLNYPGWIGNLCLTSDGLSFTGNSLYAEAPTKPTYPRSFLKRLVMEKRSTREVLDAIRGMSFQDGCLLIGDRSGHMICLEVASGQAEVRDVSAQPYGHANEILLPALQKFGNSKGPASSPLRQKNVDRLLRENAGDIDLAAIKRVLSDHTDYPLSICRHPSPKDRGTTNASFIADLTDRRMHIAIGNPCVAPFQSYDLPA
ncbi:MAG: C45 family peptidase [Bryobacteraceae bacterium]